MIEKFLESHLQAKRQTRQFYFLATNFERTRISDPRIKKLEEIIPERSIIPEVNTLGEAFLPRERRMRFCNVEEIKKNNWAGLKQFLNELLRNMDRAGVGVLSEAESIKLYDLLGVDLKLDEFPKNNEFLYDPTELSDEVIKPLFSASYNPVEALPLTPNNDQPISAKTNMVNKSTDRSVQFARKCKFLKRVEVVELNYLRQAVTETLFSKLMFDQAKSEFEQKRCARRDLSMQLVHLRLQDLFRVFNKLLTQMDPSDSVSITAATDALNSIEDKVITRQENRSIIQLFEGLQEKGKIAKNTLINLVVSEKSKVLEQELFHYQMDFFEKYLLNQYGEISQGNSSLLTFQGLANFLDEVEDISISSRQKFLLWSFLSSSGCLDGQGRLHFLSYVSVVSVYIQRVLPRLKCQGFLSLINQSSETELAMSPIVPKGPLKRSRPNRDLSPLIEDHFEDFLKRLKYFFTHLHFPMRFAQHLHKEFLVWKS